MTDKFKRFIFRIKYKLFLYLNIKQWLVAYRLRKSGKLFYLDELKEKFNNQDVFAFGTGGSVDNLKNFERLSKKNTMFLTTGPLFCYLKYGFMPNMWFVHNPESVESLIMEAENMDVIKDLDFSNTLIFIPSNSSDSKDIHFSSPTFIKFRKMIKDQAIFVLYKERYKGCLPDSDNLNDFMSSKYPIIPLIGSAVENIFIPFLHYIGVKNIFFSGVDHMDTGHFWDRTRHYQDLDGTIINFQEIQSNKFIYECGRVARKKCNEKGINVFRLEKEETILQDYEYIDFDKAFSLATSKITLQDLRF